MTLQYIRTSQGLDVFAGAHRIGALIRRAGVVWFRHPSGRELRYASLTGALRALTRAYSRAVEAGVQP